MNKPVVPVIGLKSIRGELRVLSLTVKMMIIFAALNLAAVFRLVGVPYLPEILLLIYRAMDAAIVLAFLYYCRPYVRFCTIDGFLLVFSLYPIIVGLARGGEPITFINDAAIYLSFLIKVVIFRTILTSIGKVVELDAVFRLPSKRVIFWSASFAVASLLVAYFFLAKGKNFYYQAPAELTFAAALVLAQGKVLFYFGFLILALLAGKRMVIVGILVMSVLAVSVNAKVRASVVRLLLVGVIFAILLMIGSYFFTSADFVAVDKLLGTLRQLESSSELAGNSLEVLMYLDPMRYAEFVSLQPHLKGWALWFGNGYGFRYDLDATFLQEFGYQDGAEITNAHFTPLAIVAKFGIFGLGIWMIVLALALSSRIDKRSFVQNACRLALISMIVQSVFAFGFFINFFTPFYIAVATIGGRKYFKSRQMKFNSELRKRYT